MKLECRCPHDSRGLRRDSSIQYQAPLLRRLSQEEGISLNVLFCSDFSVRGFEDPGFNVKVEWDVPLLEGLSYEFLPALGPRDRVSFWALESWTAIAVALRPL